ncbi:MAG: hypothetical protein QOK16_3195 [Solirubrobacteraceae bacterium]|jgi:DNA-binding GntR family transcriptional regulator|nr:hypothetical protein [Solirubrobacteraceae bacterium]
MLTADGDAQQLQLAPGACLLALSTTTYDRDGAALAHEIELHPSDTPITLGLITV